MPTMEGGVDMTGWSNRIGGMVLMVIVLAPGLAGTARTGVLYDEPAELRPFIGEALTANGELRSLEAEVAAMKAEVAPAGTLADPMLLIGVANLPTDTFSFNQEAMTQKQIFVSQKIPWFGKLDLKSQKAALAALKQETALEAKRLELVRMLSVTYYELGYEDRALAINAQLTQTLTQMLRVAEAGYASGRGLQQDVFQAQVELGNLLDEKITLEKQRRTLEDQVNELLNRDAFSPVTPAALPEGMPRLQLTPQAVLERTLTTNPMLNGRLVDVQRAELDVDLARRDYYPDMDFRVGYGQRDEDAAGRNLPDFFSASVTVNVPVWQRSKQDKLLEAAHNRRQAADRAYDSLTKSLPHRVDAVLKEIDAIRQNHRLFAEALLLQADEWSRSSLSAYEVGKVDFDTMIKAHIRRLRFQLQADQYRFNLYKKLAELEELAGGPESLSNATDPPSTAAVEGGNP